MPDIPRFPAFDVSSKLQQQLEFTLTSGKGDPLVGTGATLVQSIKVQQVTQNSNGTWNNLVFDQESSVKDPDSIPSKVNEDRNNLIVSYENLASVYDDEMRTYNEQINQKKSQIISIVNTAIGFGCSHVAGDAANINGVACGIGSTIRQDVAVTKIYSNMNNYSANSPFSPVSPESLSPSNSGKGFENSVSNNTGAIVGSNYRFINGLKVTFFPPGTSSDATCISYRDQINTLASEIVTLRGQRDQYLSQVNDLKKLKTKQELLKWGNNQSDSSSSEYITQLRSSIASISQYLDNIIVEDLIVHFDSAQTYGIESVLDNATGINSVTSWNNLSGDGLYATPQTSLYPINLDNSDGPSVELNNYVSSTDQYFVIGNSYIGENTKLGTGDTSYAIEVWVKITKDTNLGTSATNNGACIVGINSIHGYGLQVYKPNGIRVNFGERGSGSLVNNTDLNTNTWYHIVCTNESGVGSKIYINGVLDGTGYPINLISSTSDLHFAFAPVQISQYFSGKLSIIRIYKKNLTESDVVQNFNAHKSRYGY